MPHRHPPGGRPRRTSPQACLLLPTGLLPLRCHPRRPPRPPLPPSLRITVRPQASPSPVPVCAHAPSLASRAPFPPCAPRPAPVPASPRATPPGVPPARARASTRSAATLLATHDLPDVLLRAPPCVAPAATARAPPVGLTGLACR
nr:vegetative cell wall protein gp1-like [Aegilops tauschii subsp. strangulata]